MKARISQSPTVPLVAEAARRLREGDEEGAVASLNEAAARDPDDVRMHFVTALIAWRLGNIANALTLARSCFERDPGNGTMAEAAASLSAQSGDLAESLYYGKLAIALPADPVMREWLPDGFPKFEQAFLSIQDKPLLAQARLLAAGDQLALALDKARQHVELAHADAEGRQFLAELMLRAGEAGNAAAVLQPASEADRLAPAAASLLGRSLAAVGEAEAASRWHERAVAGAPEDAAIAARRVADAPWLQDGEQRREIWIKDWLQRFNRPAKSRQRRLVGEKLTIGYLVSGFADRRDAAAIAAIARAHLRSGATVIGYGMGEQSWSENTVLGGAFDKWRNIAGVDYATLAKMIAGDGLDVVIDAGGFAAPDQPRALARISGPLRVGWQVEPKGLVPQIYDAVIGPRSARAGGEGDLWRLPYGGYPLLRDWAHPLAPVADATCRFGADAGLAQIDAATVGLWRDVLAAVPGASLLLRANDMAIRANIDRLVRRFGNEFAARIDIVAADDADAFYRQVDIALAPARAVTPSMAAAALAAVVPVVAIEAGGPFEPCPALLREVGLDRLVATSADGYIRLAAGLAGSAAARAEAVAAAKPIAARGEGSAAEIAAAIEGAARASLARAAA